MQGIRRREGSRRRDRKLTSTQAVLGSPAYLSPEQLVSSKDVDGRTDIWAMGVILHEMLAGPPLFGGDTAGAIFTNIVTMPIPLVSSRSPGIDPRLDEIVGGCLQRNPEDRTRTALELLRRVAEVAGVRLEDAALVLPSGPAAPARLSFVPAQAAALSASAGDGKATELSNADTVVATADTVGTAAWQRPHTPSRARWAVIGGLVGLVFVVGVMWRSLTTASSGSAPPEREPAMAPPTPTTVTTNRGATETAEPTPPTAPSHEPSATAAPPASTTTPVPPPPVSRPGRRPPLPVPPPGTDIGIDERH